MPILRVETGMHNAVINRIALVKDGHELATVSDDKTARLWSMASGIVRHVWRPQIGEGDIGALLAVAASGDTLVVGGHSKTGGGVLYVFDPKTGLMHGSIGGFSAPISALAFSPDGKTLAVGEYGNGGLILIDFVGQKFKAKTQTIGQSIDWLAYAPDGRLAVSAADGTIRLFSDALQELVPAVKLPVGRGGANMPWGLAFSPDGKILAVGSLTESNIYLLGSTDLALKETLRGDTSSSGALAVVAFSPDGQHVVAGGSYRHGDGQRDLRFWPVGTAVTEQPVDIPVARDTVTDIAMLPSGEAVYASAEPSFGVVRPKKDERLHHGAHHADFRDGWRTAFAVSSDGSIIDFPTQQGGGSIERFDLKHGVLINNPSPRSDLTRAVTTDPKLKPSDWLNSTAPKLNGHVLALDPDEHVRSIAVLKSSLGVAVGTDFYLRAESAGGEVWKNVVPAPVWAVDATADGRLVVAALADGTIRWYKAGDGTPVLSLFVDPEDGRWVVWTPQGFFDHSQTIGHPGGETLVGYQLNRGDDKLGDFVQIGQLYDKFYRRDLVLANFSGDAPSAKLVIDQTSRIGDYRAVLQTGLPPSIEITTLCIIEESASSCPPDTPNPHAQDPAHPPTITGTGNTLFARYRLTARGGGIGETVVRRDQVTISGTRATERTTATEQIETLRLPLDAKGDDVSFTSVTANGAIEAAPNAALLVHVTPTAPPQAPAQQLSDDNIKLYSVLVGISQYQQTEFTLQNAANDASALYDLLNVPTPPVYMDPVQHRLIDKDATVPNILAALSDVADHARPQDLVIIFFSGHGEAIDGQYYFAPVDFATSHPEMLDEARHSSADRKAEIVDDLFRQQGLSEAQMLPIFKRIQGNMLLILDTCFSAALATGDTVTPQATDQVNARNQTAADRVGHETGRVVLAGARAFARDSSGSNDAHGLFTSYLLKGLKGDADFLHDGRINIANLVQYTQRSVAQESAKLKFDQVPYFHIDANKFFDVRAVPTAQ
jgi:WD40 repeat protein/uncharacterized caspase-like protein